MLAHSDQPAPRFADEDLDAHAIGRFAVLRKVGEGGMGAVYAAFDERLARRVAIKLLHGVDHARLLREAQALARLSHPHVVQVYEVGEASGRIFVAMEYVEGPTLAAWRTATPRDAAAILAVYLQAGAGLQAAHASGLVHRDFKPGNVIVGDDGRARVLDFGLARAGDSMTDGEVPRTGGYFGSLTSPLTQTGALMGTPAYMSPEQHAALPLDARSDQFSFCAALYEALYDERPYAGDNVADMTTSMFSGSMRAPRPRPDVPPAVHAAIVRGLAVDPAARWSSMEELLQVLASGQRQSVTVGDIRVWRWFAAGMLVLLLAAATTAIHQANRAGLQRVRRAGDAVSHAVAAAPLPEATRAPADRVRADLRAVERGHPAAPVVDGRLADRVADQRVADAGEHARDAGPVPPHPRAAVDDRPAAADNRDRYDRVRPRSLPDRHGVDADGRARPRYLALVLAGRGLTTTPCAAERAVSAPVCRAPQSLHLSGARRAVTVVA